MWQRLADLGCGKRSLPICPKCRSRHGYGSRLIIQDRHADIVAGAWLKLAQEILQTLAKTSQRKLRPKNHPGLAWRAIPKQNAEPVLDKSCQRSLRRITDQLPEFRFSGGDLGILLGVRITLLGGGKR